MSDSIWRNSGTSIDKYTLEKFLYSFIFQRKNKNELLRFDEIKDELMEEHNASLTSEQLEKICSKYVKAGLLEANEDSYFVSFENGPII